MAVMRPLLLVHGNFSASWSWFDVVPMLRARGYPVFTVDLQWKPNHSGHRPTVTDHAQQISKLITSETLTKVVLVAHSYAGVPVQQVIADSAGDISAVFFLDAHIVSRNQSISQLVPQETLGNVQKEADHSDGYFFREVLPYEAVKHAFFPHMTEEEAREAYARMHPDYIGLWKDVLKLPDNYTYPTHIEYHYVRFTDDQAITPDYWPETTQRLAQLVKLHVHSMPGRHFGFLEHPEQAVDIIDSVLSGSAVP